ncbi:interleukin-33 isoform X1 [Molossus molossus]|uniref:Interleukin-33 n=1 Tax=Molossus molossus TaxID=27622 RepID=A0A7J8EEN8_MOLMO|nr:interleukin-33 isoform X1 [Molossus molossus]KAF6433619.1 interleukin 33 [Molossus molossus]
MKYRATKTSPAKMNNSAGKAPVKSTRLRKSQQKTKEVCQVYFMKLRSGKEKKSFYVRKETTTSSSPKTAGNYKEPHLVFTACQKHLEDLERSAEAFAFDIPMVQKHTRTINDSSIQERSFCLSTYNNQAITFAHVDGSYEIYVEDERKEQKKDKVLFRFYDSQPSESETGDSVDGQKSMVSLSPTKDKAVLLHANNEEDSVELQKCENLLPDQTFFFLHTEPGPSTCVSFECKSNPGVYIGVKDNHLALIKLKDQSEHSRENIKFKVS